MINISRIWKHLIINLFQQCHQTTSELQSTFFITFCFILDRISSVWAAAFINLSINFLQYFLDYLLFAQEISILVHNSLLLLHPSKIVLFYLISLSAEITANLFWNCLWCVTVLLALLINKWLMQQQHSGVSCKS